MPMYLFQCTNPDCGRMFHDRRNYDARDNPSSCGFCLRPVHRLIGAPNLNRRGSESDDPIERFQFEHLSKD